MISLTHDIAPIRDRSVHVTVVIPTLNEADRLMACLESVRWAADVIVVDGGSSDETPAIACRAGARVLHTAGLTIGAQRNAARPAARHAWVLYLDADERASPELARFVARIVQQPADCAWRIPFRNAYLGAPMTRGCWGRDHHVRLAPATARWSTHAVHEHLLTDGAVRNAIGHIDHNSYRDLAHQLTKVHRYAASGAQDLAARDQRVGATELFARPLWRFVKLYVLDGAWRDGARGFILSVVHAWSAFAKYALRWDAERVASLAVMPLESGYHAPLPRYSQPNERASWSGA